MLRVACLFCYLFFQAILGFSTEVTLDFSPAVPQKESFSQADKELIRSVVKKVAEESIEELIADKDQLIINYISLKELDFASLCSFILFDYEFSDYLQQIVTDDLKSTICFLEIDSAVKQLEENGTLQEYISLLTKVLPLANEICLMEYIQQENYRDLAQYLLSLTQPTIFLSNLTIDERQRVDRKIVQSRD